MAWHTRTRRNGRPTFVALLSYAALSLFLIVFLFLGLFSHSNLSLKKKPEYDFPDFDRIQTFARTLSENEINLSNPQARIIFMGDIHGMNRSLHELLHKLEWDASHDTLFFAGDLLAKSSHASSLSVIEFLTEHHKTNSKETIFPVRGNHDQFIVQWRAWRDWFEELELPAKATAAPPRLFPAAVLAFQRAVPSLLRSLIDPSSPVQSKTPPPVNTGREFLQLLEAEWAIARLENDADPEEYAYVARKRAHGTWRERWWRRIPQPGTGKRKQDWKLFGDHYWLARDITEDQASYLFSLPLVLHIPHLHFFVAHAGILPSDPRLPPTDPAQPLAHPPILSRNPDSEENKPIQSRLQAHLSSFAPRSRQNLEALRRLQEGSILTDVPQNRDPWVILNMRSVTKKKHQVTRDGEKGTPWSKIWNRQMKKCRGFDPDHGQEPGGVHAAKKDKGSEEDYTLPCEPATVIYGHAASRGLDVKRWSMGLDTGCLYGEQLTALVLTNATSVRSGAVDEDWESAIDQDNEDDDEDDENDEDDDDDNDEEDSRRPDHHVRFGDTSSGIDARLYHVKCPNMDDYLP